jgi:hypothetical protein
MNGIRKVLVLVAAFALAALALPGMADPVLKSYSIQFLTNPTYTAGDVVVPVPATVTIQNDAPPGTANSNIGSFTFSITNLKVLNTAGFPLTCPGASTCTVDPTTNVVTVAGISPPIQAGNRYTVSMYLSSCGEGSLANITVYNGQLGGQPFGQLDVSGFPNILTQSISCGTLACPDTFTLTRVDTALKAGTVSGTLYSPNKIGACNPEPDYFLTNAIINPTPFAHFKLDDEFAVVSYTINYPGQNVVGATPPTAHVGWLKCTGGLADGTEFSDVQGCLITAPLCTTSAAPQAYANLASTISSSATPTATVQVTTLVSNSNIPKPPFAIEIVNDDQVNTPGAERLLVTKMQGSTWTVKRCDGMTCPNGTPSHTFTNVPTPKLMSTPLPTLTVDYLGNAYSFPSGPPSGPSPQYTAGYRVGMQAQMCLISMTGPLVEPTDITKTYYPSNFYDIGDGYHAP